MLLVVSWRTGMVECWPRGQPWWVPEDSPGGQRLYHPMVIKDVCGGDFGEEAEGYWVPILVLLEGDGEEGV